MSFVPKLVFRSGSFIKFRILCFSSRSWTFNLFPHSIHRCLIGSKFMASFCVRAEVSLREIVCVSGNCPSLGNWKPDRVLPLTLERDGSRDIWSGTASIPANFRVQYRYVICTILNADNENKTVIVRRWETNLVPRQLVLDGLNANSVIDDFGNYGGKCCIQDGWLTAETLIQLKFYNNPLQIWKQEFADKKLNMQVAAISLQKHEVEGSNDADFETLVLPTVNLAVMNKDEFRFVQQNDFGRTFMPDEFFTFQTKIMSIDKVGFRINFYLCDAGCKNPDSAKLVGFSLVLPGMFARSTGINVIPVLGLTHLPIGQIVVDHLVVRPMKNQECSLDVSYKNYWNRERGPLEVGHRGSGSSFKDIPACASIRENTVASFQNAAKHGADYVEFDVQLSKDNIPVIYHDYHVCVSSKKREGASAEIMPVWVHELTLQQLQELKVFHTSEKSSDSVDASSAKPREFACDEREDGLPFPLLRTVFEKVGHNHMGFNVEIKWGLPLKDIVIDVTHPTDLNEYLDVIVAAVQEHAGDRRIIYSCFHPDVCTMLQQKQNRYPVLFLTQGETKRWPGYSDPRTSSIPHAIYFAQSSDILGIDVHTEDILVDESLVKLCLDTGLVMFCWGEDNNDLKVISKLKKLGLHGIIYDGIDVLKTVKESIYQLEPSKENV